jgi:hypothetical protein
MNLSPHRLVSSVTGRIRRVLYRATGRKVVHLIHIGKTGGTAIKDTLSPVAVTPRHILVMHSHSTTLADIPRGDDFMFFLRDPLSRFVSGFYSRQRQGQPRRFSKWSHQEELAFARFQTPNDLGRALSADDPEQRQAAVDAMNGISHVRDSYWKWFGSREALATRSGHLFFIGRQESLAADFDRLRQLLGLPQDVRLPDDPVKSHRRPGNLDDKLDEVARRNLEDWYRQDYEFIGFCQSLRPEWFKPADDAQ